MYTKIKLTLCAGLLLGGAVGHVSAKLFKFDPADVATGSYGFNGALVGVGLFFFHSNGLSSVALILVGATLSTFIMKLILRWGRLPPYTAPFVIAMWLMLLIANVLALGEATPANDSGQVGEFWVLTRGVGQVMFQSHWVTGVIFIVGIAFNSPTAAAWALIGSAIGLVTARGFQLSGLPSLTAPFIISAWLVTLVTLYLQSIKAFQTHH